ncbi:MAG TPA: sulfate ABC transporter substrate-binding protein [Caldilineaceae bacterium]|nr:sulfate ABC transporter substrate-binding protein [Caldilineaceae bacterium]
MWSRTVNVRSVKAFVLAGLLLLLAACAAATANHPENTASAGSEPVTLILGAYTTPREAYGEIIPLFQAHWREQTGQEVVFEESYLGSGAQSRAIVEGFEADIAALSLEADITRIEEAGLITHDWRSLPHEGIVSTSVVAFAVRPGNPKNIQDWDDLAQPGLEILTPNPKTSGGAMWNILALYGAAKRGFVEGVPAGNDAAAQAFLISVLNNVTVMDKGARESITNFEQGVGDVAITYENEVLVGQKSGQDYELVLPRSSILIENPVAVVDAYVDAHGTREVAEAFVQFLFSKAAQEIFAEYGLRAVDEEVAAATAEQYPALEDLFTIEEFGGWAEATPAFFGDQGIFTQAVGQIQRLAQ